MLLLKLTAGSYSAKTVSYFQHESGSWRKLFDGVISEDYFPLTLLIQPHEIELKNCFLCLHYAAP